MYTVISNIIRGLLFALILTNAQLSIAAPNSKETKGVKASKEDSKKKGKKEKREKSEKETEKKKVKKDKGKKAAAEKADIKKLKTEKAAEEQSKTPEDKTESSEFDLYSYFPKYLSKALKAYEEEKFHSCLSILDKAKLKVTAKTEYPDRYFLLRGICALRVGDPRQARNYLFSSLKARRGNSDTLYFMARSLEALGSLNEAQAYYEEALWFEKFGMIKAEEIYFKLGVMHLNHANRLSMTAAEEEADAVKTEDITRLREAGQKAIQSALKKDSGFIPARLRVITINLEDGNKTQAVKNARSLLEANPENPEAKVILAQTLLFRPDRVLGRNDIIEAKEITTKLSKREDLPPSLHARAQELRIQAFMEEEDLDGAKALLVKAKEQHPEYPGFKRLEDQLAVEEEAEAAEQEALERDAAEAAVTN